MTKCGIIGTPVISGAQPFFLIIPVGGPVAPPETTFTCGF